MQLQQLTLTVLLLVATASTQNIFEKITSKANEIFDDVTEKGGDIFGEVTSFADTVFDHHNTRDVSSMIQSITRVANSVMAEVTGDTSHRMQDVKNAASSAVDNHGKDSSEATSALSRFSRVLASITRDSSYPEQTGSREKSDEDNDSAAGGIFVPANSFVIITLLLVLGLL